MELGLLSSLLNTGEGRTVGSPRLYYTVGIHGSDFGLQLFKPLLGTSDAGDIGLVVLTYSGLDNAIDVL